MADKPRRPSARYGRKTAVDGTPPSWLLQLKLEQVRRQGNGLIRRPRATLFDFINIDILEASQQADLGDVGLAAQYWASCYRDPTFLGLLSTRSAGLVSLPKTYKGTQRARDFLSQGYGSNPDDPQSGFDWICPPQELASFVQDLVGLGAAVALLVDVEGSDVPAFVRLDSTGLQYRPTDNTWTYTTDGGPVAITPGVDGWVLATHGRSQPWRNGVWAACTKAVTRKEHALLSLDSYLAAYGVPARHGTYPEGASPVDREAFAAIVSDWQNTTLTSPQNYEVKMLELRAGEGTKVFLDLAEACNREVVMALCGQLQTMEGGKAFTDSQIHNSIRLDLIRQDAQILADCLNSQVMPQALASYFGEDSDEQAFISYEVEPPRDLNLRAQALIASAAAIQNLTGKALGDQAQVDITRLCEELNVPLLQAQEIVAQKPKLQLVDGGKS